MRRLFVILFVFVFMIIATAWDRRIKDYDSFFVDEEDIIDFNAMISPPEKYSKLLIIDLNTRKLVAEHMKMNNYKLKPGKQEFIKNNPTLRELLASCFRFEVIE